MENSTHTSLYRPGEGRWIAGVALGLAHRLGIKPWIVRVGFLILVPVGGAGIFLYAAGWLLIPDEGEAHSIARGWSGPPLGGCHPHRPRGGRVDCRDQAREG